MTTTGKDGPAGLMDHRTPDLRRLGFLVRIIDLGSITRAAEALGIAQPALSQHIQALERSFGTPLLTRGTQGVRPTPAGDVVYRNAKLLARQVDRARAEVDVLSHTPAGRVAVGIAPHGPARRLVRPLLRAARDRLPAVVVHISENFEGALTADLLLKRLDMAFLYEIAPRPGLRYAPLCEERLQIVGAAPLLAGRRSAEIPLLLPQPTHALRQLVDATFGHDERPLVLAEIESFETLASAVKAGLGATILPDAAARELALEGGLRLRAFGGPRTSIGLSLCSVEGDSPSTAVQAVLALAREMVTAFLPETPARNGVP